MMKRLAAAGVLSAALGGVLLTSTPALAGGGDDYEIHQEKLVELNIGCNIAILSVQEGGNCGGSYASID